MARRGLRWFKLDIDMLHDPSIQALMDEYGRDGLAVWVADMTNMYAAINEGYDFLPVETLCRRVASDLRMQPKRVKSINFFATKLGLFDESFWKTGKAANERICEVHADYLRRCESAEAARAAKGALKSSL